MSYEFKKISDVDIVETPSDIANVLIEENGVIKKAPKTAIVGSDTNNSGDRSGDYAAIIHFDGGNERALYSIESATVVEGSFQKVYEMLKNREHARILISWHFDYDVPVYFYSEASSLYSYGGASEIKIFFVNLDGKMEYCCLLQDNQITFAPG